MPQAVVSAPQVEDTTQDVIVNAPMDSLGDVIKNTIQNEIANTFVKLTPEVTTPTNLVVA